jgi:hypothetical protein
MGRPRGDRGNQRRRAVLLPGEDDILLRSKIVEEVAARNVGSGSDVVERGRFKTALAKKPSCAKSCTIIFRIIRRLRLNSRDSTPASSASASLRSAWTSSATGI